MHVILFILNLIIKALVSQYVTKLMGLKKHTLVSFVRLQIALVLRTIQIALETILLPIHIAHTVDCILFNALGLGSAVKCLGKTFKYI